MSEFFSREVSLDFTDSAVLGMFALAIVAGIIFLIVFVWLAIKAQKLSGVKGISQFNLLNIILFALPVAGLILIPYFRNNFVLWCGITAVIWAVPTVLNVKKASGSGIIFSVLQLIYGLIIAAVVQTIWLSILMIVGLVFVNLVVVDEFYDFIMIDSTGKITYVAKTGKGSFMDDSGNYYTHTGTPGEYIDSHGNIYRFKRRK